MRENKLSRHRRGITLAELMVVLAMLGLLASVIVPRVVGHYANAKRAACNVNQGEIELQVKLWRRNHGGAYPAANLSNIGADPNYFPQGLPTCPVDGSAYTINTTSGTVIGHTH